MIPVRLLPWLTPQRFLITGGVLLLLTAGSFRFGGHLKNSILKADRAYQNDLSLHRHKDQYKNIYRRMIAGGRLPEPGALGQNEWVQWTQTWIEEHNLYLEELTPLEGGGEGGPKIVLTLEGAMTDILNLIYKLPQAENGCYLEKFLLRPAPDPGRLSSELTLSKTLRGRLC